MSDVVSVVKIHNTKGKVGMSCPNLEFLSCPNGDFRFFKKGLVCLHKNIYKL
jgi:hypothetical protein